jgi:pilus assembly protein FimV
MILLGFLIPMQVYALGLGELQTHSALNQPFDADLELTTTNPSELSGLEVKLASEEDFARAGIERLPVLNALRFKVVRKNGRAYVHITSPQAILEPYLNFLVEVNWSRGRLLREFTVLLDPPELLGGEAAGVESPEAMGAAPSRPAPAPSARTEAPISTPAGGGKADFPLVYGPIEKNEMLWNIATKMRGDLEATVPQVMMALLRNNPKAFIDHNVNRVKSGFVLRIDEVRDIYAMSPEEARKAFRHQYQLWLDYKQRRAMQADKRVHDREIAEQRRRMREERHQAATGASQKQGVLTLERPEGDKQVGGQLESGAVGSGQESEELKRLRRQLAEAQQSAETNQKQNEAMHERLQAMEDQIAALQRLMSVRSDELTSLQEKMATEEPAPADKTETAEQAGLLDKLGGGVKGLLQTLRENPQTMGIIGGGLLLLLTTLWLLMRRRKQGGLDRFSYQPAGGGNDFDTPMGSPWEEDTQELDADLVESWVQPESAPAARGAASEMEEDPVTQADIFVAYGNLDAAVEVMEEAVNRWPDKGDYQRKLTELKDRRAAVLTPEENEAVLGGGPAENAEPVSTPMEEAPEQAFLTDEDLQAFEEEMQTGGEAAEKRPSSPEPETGQEDEIHSALSDFGFDLGEEHDEHELPPRREVEADEGLEFDLGDIHSELEQLTVDEGHVSADEHESAIPEFDLQDLEEGLEEEQPETPQAESETAGLDLDLEIPEPEPAESLAEEAKPAVEEPADQSEELEFDTDSLIEVEDHEPDLLNDVDEVGTKLDLARAYIDMGDPEGARSILEEVLKEGNEHQIQEANGLLGQIQ